MIDTSQKVKILIDTSQRVKILIDTSRGALFKSVKTVIGPINI